MNTKHRRVNDHNPLKAVTNQAWEILSEEKYHPPTPEEYTDSVKELTVQVDGGYTPIKEKCKRRFEALGGIFDRPKI